MYCEQLGVDLENLRDFSRREIVDRINSLTEEQVHEIARSRLYVPCLERLQELEKQLNETLEGKEEIIRLLVACTIAQVPMILLGPPGTAKSLVVRQFCAFLGLRPHHEDIHEFGERIKQALHSPEAAPGAMGVGYRPLFEYLVTRFTTPEEIIGPVNITALLRLALFYRDPEGMLPSAEIAFLDEIFKANSAILNSLLAIINERIYYNAGRVFDVRLVNVFGASNEPPDAEELAALYDRFPIRVVSRPVSDDRVSALIDRALRHEYRQALGDASTNGRGGWRRSTTEVACVNDFRLLSKVIYVKFGGQDQFAPSKRGRGFSFADAFVILFKQLRSEYEISDRTPERLVRVARALALLDRRDELSPQDLCVFKYCTPDIESAEVLADTVDDYINSL